MEGTIFYWFSWMAWIYITFSLRRDHQYRLQLAIALLGIIICSAYSIPFYSLHINMAFICLLFIVYYGLIGLASKQLLFMLISSSIVSLIYGSFQLLELFDPVWILFKKEWMLSFILFYTTILLHRNLQLRVYLLLSGVIQGEILYSLVLNSKHFQREIGALQFLDICSISLMSLLCWGMFEKIVYILESYFESNRKEKQRIS